VNNPLVPQLRPDKNGKLVTRHVADVTASASLSSPLPAPVLTVTPQAPEKTEKELHKEAYEALAARLVGDADEDKRSKYNDVRAALSWFNSTLLQNLNDMLDHKPPYQTQSDKASSAVFLLTSGKSFTVAMSASVYDIGNKCADAGMTNIISPDGLSRDYFHRPNYSSNIRDSHIKDFRAAYLATVLELDEDEHANGKGDYYRELEKLSDSLDDVINALPVFKTIMDDDDRYYMMDDGILTINEISKHLSNRSQEEVQRVASFIKERGKDLNSYDEFVIDEMLDNTEAAVGNGWL
jgi:hypothetical protein